MAMKRTGFNARSKPLHARKPVNKVSANRKAASQARGDNLTPLQRNAEGKPCTLRLPGCRHDPAYSVLCHLRRNGWGGMGLKPHDVLAVIACDKCHEKQERHHPDCTDADLLRALGETILMQISVIQRQETS